MKIRGFIENQRFLKSPFGKGGFKGILVCTINALTAQKSQLNSIIFLHLGNDQGSLGGEWGEKLGKAAGGAPILRLPQEQKKRLRLLAVAPGFH